MWIDREVVVGESRVQAAAAGGDLDDVFGAEFRRCKTEGIVGAREVAVQHLRDDDPIASGSNRLTYAGPITCADNPVHDAGSITGTHNAVKQKRVRPTILRLVTRI